MRYRADHKQKTHDRIVAEAAATMRRDGLRGATVERVMAGAGLSHGGFYAHFGSKDDMAMAGLARAFAETREALFAGLDDASGEDWVRQVVARYLGRAHRDAEDAGCPLPRLAGEAARAGPALRRTAEEGIEEYAAALAAQLDPGARGDGRDAEATSSAYSLLALMVGGITLARVVDDPALSDGILRACRHAAHDMAANTR